MEEPPDLLTNPELNVLMNGLLRAAHASWTEAAVERPIRIQLDGEGAAGGRRVLPGVSRISAVAAATVEVELAAFCDAEVLRLCECVNADVERDGDDPMVRSGGGAHMVDQLAETLTWALNDDVADESPGDAQAYPVYVEWGRMDGRALAREHLGDDWARPFDPAVVREENAAAERAARNQPAPEAARRDRGALAEWLRGRQVLDPERIADEFASIGYRLFSTDRPTRTRLYGPGLLPPGEPWPTTTKGRPLTFLAIFDLGEFASTVPGAPALPGAGCLLFFADIGWDDDIGYTWDGAPVRNAPGEAARVFWVPGGEDPVAAASPPPLSGGREPLPADHRAPEQSLLIHDEESLSGFLLQDWKEARPLEDAAGELRHGAAPDGRVPFDIALCGPTIDGAADDRGGAALLLRLRSVEFQDTAMIEFRLSPEAFEPLDLSQAFAVAVYV